MNTSAIRKHADKYPGHVGKVELRNKHCEAYGIYGATFVPIRRDCIEYYVRPHRRTRYRHGQDRNGTASELPLFGRNPQGILF